MAVCQVGAAKSMQQAIRAVSMLWLSTTKRKGHTKTNAQVKKYLYNWILQYPQVVKFPTANYHLKVSIYGHSEPQ